MIPLNIVYPFFYIMDIVKDFVQLVLLLDAVGGLSLTLNDWSSFSSTVSNYHSKFFSCFSMCMIKQEQSGGTVD